MGQIQPQSTTRQPSVEEILTESLKPYDLRNAQTHKAYLQRLLDDFQSGKDPRTILGQSSTQIKNIIAFLGKLETFSTKEQRTEWYRSTYSSKSSSTPALKVENDQLKKNLQKCQEDARDFSETEVMIDSLKSELNRLQKVIDDREREIKSLEQRLPTESRQLKANFERVSAQNQTLVNQLKDVTERLAKEMDTKVSKTEGALENINIKNRPMKIAEEYHLFQGDSWFAAKQKLDDAKIPNDKAIKILLDTLMAADEEAYIRHQEVMNAIYHAISKQGASAPAPLDFSSIDFKKKVDTIVVKKIPDGVKNGIRDFLRINADTADVSILVQATLDRLKKSADDCIRKSVRGMPHSERFNVRNLKLEEYMKECARLTWKMALQTPQMSFDNETGIGEKWTDGKNTELIFGSGDPDISGNVVKFYVFPILTHGDRVMVKGRVFVDKQ